MCKVIKRTLKVILAFTAVCLLMLNVTSCSFVENKYIEKNYSIDVDFNDILIEASISNVSLELSEDQWCRVICSENADFKYSVTVSENKLKILEIDNRSWIKKLFTKQNRFITVYLPKSEYSSLEINAGVGNIKLPSDFAFNDIDVSLSVGDLVCNSSAAERVQIDSSTGNVIFENATFKHLTISLSTGNVSINDVNCAGDLSIDISTGRTQLNNVNCNNLYSTGSTGKINMKQVIAQNKINVERSTGDISFECCDAAELFVQTSTGDIEGSLNSPKVFVYSTSTGKVSLPKTTTGGKCELNTSTGDIAITINE